MYWTVSFLHFTHTVGQQGILISPLLLLERRGKILRAGPEDPELRNHLICCCFHKSGPSHQFHHIFESTCYWQCVRGEKWSLLAKLFHFLKIKLFIVQAAICPPWKRFSCWQRHSEISKTKLNFFFFIATHNEWQIHSFTHSSIHSTSSKCFFCDVS